MNDGPVNYLAILSASVISNVLLALWYGPKVFGTVWRKISKTEISKQKTGFTHYFGSFLLSLVTATAIAWLVIKLDFTLASEGLKLGFLVWLGFIATPQFYEVIWEKKPLKLYCINAGYHLANLLVLSTILSVWR